MKKLLLLITYNVSLIAFCAAQNPMVKQWDKRFGGDSTEYLYSFKQTIDGGYIVGGSTSSGVSGDKTQPSWGFYDYWIVKTDSAGNKQWDKRFGGTQWDDAFCLHQTMDGGYIMAGRSGSGINGDKTEPSWGGFDGWILKTDSLGNKLWDKRFGGFVEDFFFSILQLNDGGYIAGGSTNSGVSGDITQPSIGSFDYWLVRIDSIGNKQWDKRIGGFKIDILSSLQQTTEGGFILGGRSFSDIGGDKTQDNWSVDTADYWIVKTDSLGNIEWDKRFGGTGDDRFANVQQTNDKGYVLGGWSRSEISGDKTQVLLGHSDYWIVKTDSLGNKEWDKRFGGSSMEEDFGNILQTLDGGYLMAGSSYSNIGGDKTENNLGIEQSWVVKTDSLGNKQWDKTLFTTGHDEQALAIQSHDGCYVFTNATNGGIGGYKTQPNWDTTNQTSDYWIVKFCDSTSTTSITQLPNQPIAFSIYPNPAGKELKINLSRFFRENAELKIKEIEIYDLFGRRVLKSEVGSQRTEVGRQKTEMTINISKLSPGIYFLKAGNEVRKFVKE